MGKVRVEMSWRLGIHHYSGFHSSLTRCLLCFLRQHFPSIRDARVSLGFPLRVASMAVILLSFAGSFPGGHFAFLYGQCTWRSLCFPLRVISLAVILLYFTDSFPGGHFALLPVSFTVTLLSFAASFPDGHLFTDSFLYGHFAFLCCQFS